MWNFTTVSADFMVYNSSMYVHCAEDSPLLPRRRLPSTAESSANNERLDKKKNCTFRRPLSRRNCFFLDATCSTADTATRCVVDLNRAIREQQPLVVICIIVITVNGGSCLCECSQVFRNVAKVNMCMKI